MRENSICFPAHVNQYVTNLNFGRALMNEFFDSEDEYVCLTHEGIAYVPDT